MKGVCACLRTLRLLFESEYWVCSLFDEANNTKRPRHNLAKHLLCSNSRKNDIISCKDIVIYENDIKNK